MREIRLSGSEEGSRWGNPADLLTHFHNNQMLLMHSRQAVKEAIKLPLRTHLKSK